MAYSTAVLLSTGSEPGRPRHTGQMLVFGSAPKLLRHPQNSFVWVLSSVWTSSPITVSHEVVVTVTRHLPPEQPLQAPRPLETSPSHPTPAPAPAHRRATRRRRCRTERSSQGDPPGSTEWCTNRTGTWPTDQRSWPPARMRSSVQSALAARRTTRTRPRNRG